MIGHQLFVTNCHFAGTNGVNAAPKSCFDRRFVPPSRNIADNLPLPATSKLKNHWLLGDQNQSQIDMELQRTGLRSVALEICN